MIRHLTIAALRNMAANKLLSAISILGLSIGIAAAILMGLVIRNQMSFEAYLPLHERTYLAASPPNPLLVGIGWSDMADYRTASFLKLNAPEVESIARMAVARSSFSDKLQHGTVVGWDPVYWADPNIFDILRLPVFQGDLGNALAQPDSIVLSRAMAEKYFGNDNVVGQIILVNDHPMMIRAIIQNYPANATGLKSSIFASGLSSASRLPESERPFSSDWSFMEPEVYTYMRLRAGADIASLEKKVAAHYAPMMTQTEAPLLRLLRLDKVNLFEPLHPGIHNQIATEGLAGFLILIVVAINFVNLTVARSTRREKEVGIRKTCGAGRQALVVQFLGEAVALVGIASVIALAAGEWLLPPLNTFLETGARLNNQDQFQMPVALLLGILLLALSAGAYPAFLLSSFSATSVLRGWTRMTGRAGVIRNLLVTLQFAVLVGFAIAAGVVWQQRQFATGEALRLNVDEMLILKLDGTDAPFTASGKMLKCAPVLENELHKLPGVRGVACSGTALFQAIEPNIIGIDPVTHGNKSLIGFRPVDPNVLALYDVKPLAGSLSNVPNGEKASVPGVVINQSAVRKLGFSSSQAAIGHSWIPSGLPQRAIAYYDGPRSIITAVVPDFSFHPVERTIGPEVFLPWIGVGPGRLIHVKLDGRKIPETLAEIDRLWTETGMRGPEDRFLLGDYMQQQYLHITRQAQMLAIFASIAILLASLGLVGIAVSTAERRTKEIGIRKAMGATTGGIVTLLLWQFSKPVLWANLVAWPVAWWLMRRWLNGFAYHVELHAWLFVGASAVALLVAFITVAMQALLVARQKPVLALRYE